MKRYLALVAACLGLSACGHAAATPAVKQDTKKAEAIVKRCVPDPRVLRNKATRERAIACAVPPAHRAKAERCAFQGILKGLPTKRRLEALAVKCVGEAE